MDPATRGKLPSNPQRPASRKRRHSMFKAIPAALLIASALLSTTAANAATGTSLAVGYGDLDLSTDDGQGDLQRRIAFAAGAVCEYNQFADISRMSIGKACRSG